MNNIAYSSVLYTSIVVQNLVKTHKRVILLHWVLYILITANTASTVYSETVM